MIVTLLIVCASYITRKILDDRNKELQNQSKELQKVIDSVSEKLGGEVVPGK